MALFGSLFAPARRPTSASSALDLVTRTAALASNPDAIDLTLDQLRAITARLVPGQQPTSKDTEQLLQVYLELEKYLTTQEPLRAFTTEQLRARCAPQLLADLETYEHNHKES